MAREIEIKLRVTDPDALRRRLKAQGAAGGGIVLETNHILDTPDGRLRDADCGLRIRTNRDPNTPAAETTTLTFKGPRQPATEITPDRPTAGADRPCAAPKARLELETTVSDRDVLAEILARLGFNVAVVYEKRRETWRVGRCAVALDELPGLGWFAEIEGPDNGAVGAVRDEIGLNHAPVVAETYVELAARHGRLDAAGRRSLRFS